MALTESETSSLQTSNRDELQEIIGLLKLAIEGKPDTNPDVIHNLEIIAFAEQLLKRKFNSASQLQKASLS